MGKRIPAKYKKSARLFIMITDDERKILEERAKLAHLNISSYIRTICFSETAPIK